jgi:hypothetical protein
MFILIPCQLLTIQHYLMQMISRYTMFLTLIWYHSVIILNSFKMTFTKKLFIWIAFSIILVNIMTWFVQNVNVTCKFLPVLTKQLVIRKCSKILSRHEKLEHLLGIFHLFSMTLLLYTRVSLILPLNSSLTQIPVIQ